MTFKKGKIVIVKPINVPCKAQNKYISVNILVDISGNRFYHHTRKR